MCIRDSLKGVTTFGWAVTTFTPLVVALVGSSIWMGWSDNIVSWELGISMIALASLSMWLSLRANSGIIFSVVAVTSGLLPLLYEYNNEDVGSGGALSLLVFIIGVQGILAADKRLRQDLMQITSIFLVGEVIIAMIIAGEGDFELILGPIRQNDLGELAPYLNLQSWPLDCCTCRIFPSNPDEKNTIHANRACCESILN